MNKYRYIGTTEIQLMGYGIVKPNEVVEVKYKIYHPLFIKVEKETSKKTKQ